MSATYTNVPYERCEICGERFFTPYAKNYHKIIAHPKPKPEAEGVKA